MVLIIGKKCWLLFTTLYYQLFVGFSVKKSCMIKKWRCISFIIARNITNDIFESAKRNSINEKIYY